MANVEDKGQCDLFFHEKGEDPNRVEIFENEASLSCSQDSATVTNTDKRKRVYSFEFGDSDDEQPQKPLRFTGSVSKLCVTLPPGDKQKENSPHARNSNTEDLLTFLDKENVPGEGISSCFGFDKEETLGEADKPDSKNNKTTTNNETNTECSLLEVQNNVSCTNSVTPESELKKRQVLELGDCHRVLYTHSQHLIDYCNQLPRIAGRADLVHSLIEALGILNYLVVVPPKQADDEEVKKFHSTDYIDFLQRINQFEDEEKIDPEEAEQYGLTYDCPVEKGVYDCAALVAGATITAAEALCQDQCSIAINWCGGWHHAQRSEASGFCYINDIVLGILKLRSKFSRVLYVDIDLHHGDGVENAFITTPHVLTVSFHKYDAGFFPGTGSINDVGTRGGKYYNVNVPLKDGVRDDDFVSVFRCVMSSVRESYDPEVVVCQCGADGLAGDPMSSFNLTLTAYKKCLYFLMCWKLPLLLLGGGGYDYANTARCWASLTALTVGRKLPEDVPDHEYFTKYGPDYELTLQAGNMKNYNTSQNLKNICRVVTENLQKIKGRQV